MCAGGIAGGERPSTEREEWKISWEKGLMLLPIRSSLMANSPASSAPTIPSSILLLCFPYVLSSLYSSLLTILSEILLELDSSIGCKFPASKQNCGFLGDLCRNL